mgnify:CR=1 FL=1
MPPAPQLTKQSSRFDLLEYPARFDKDVIDETPMAYKDIDRVMKAQSALVDIVHTLKQVVCVKG